MVLTRTKVPVVAARLRPPALPSKVLFTSRHQVLADKVLCHRLTAIIAPAGYGKTTFLAGLAVRLGQGSQAQQPASAADAASRCGVAWYTVSEMDADPATFFTHFIAALEMATPGCGSDTLRVLGSVTDVSRESHLIAAALCEELWKQGDTGRTRGVLVVLDDYHLVGGVPSVSSVVQFLLTNLPPAYRLCLASRERPPLDTSRLALNDQYLEVQPRDIAFNEEEVRSYLNVLCGLGLDDRQVSELAAITEGWPAGLVLATQAIALIPRPEVSRTIAAFTGRQEAIFSFFSNQVLSRLDEETRRFLIDAADLRYLTAEACAAVLGEQRAEERLETVLRQGLFLTVTQAGDERVYRFHRLFQGALALARKRYMEPGAIRDLDLRAAEYYEKSGRLDAAMEHHLAAGDTAGAAALLRRKGEQITAQGYVEQMRYWLRALPRELVDNDPYLLFFMGSVHQHSDHSVALYCLDRAARGLAERGELRLEVRALIYMATIYGLQNRVDKVRETAARIPALKAMSRDPWARGVLVVAALCQATWDDNLRRGVWLGRLSRLVPLDEDWRWAMLAYSCMLYYRLGDLRLARRVIEEALQMDAVRSNDVWLGMALILYHVVLYSEDDNQTGEKVRNELWDLGERYDSAYYKAYAQRAMAFPHKHRGRINEAKELLLSSLYFFERAGNGAMAAITRLDLALLETEAGTPGAALSSARQAFSDLCALDCGQGLAEQGQSLLGAVAREAGDLELAEKHLQVSARISRQKGAKQILCGTLLHLAQLYTVKRMDEAADEHLRQALDIAEAAGYVVFWDFHRPTVLNVCLRALERGIRPAHAAMLLAHWFGAEAVVPFMAQLQPAETGPRHRREESRRRSLEVRLLGDFEARVDGVKVAERDWQTRQVKKLFKYLVLERGRKVSRDRLMDFLWPDADPQAAAASLRVTLSRLRQALLDARENTPLVITAQGNVWLNEDNDILVDIDQFLGLINCGQGAAEKGDLDRAGGAFEDAIALYRGDFLSEDIYEDWTAAERERLQILYLDALLTLAQIYRTQAGGEAGHRRARDLLLKALATNPYREDINKELMESYLSAGQAGEALRLFVRYKELIYEELGIQPGAEVLRLAEKAGYRRSRSIKA